MTNLKLMRVSGLIDILLVLLLMTGCTTAMVNPNPAPIKPTLDRLDPEQVNQLDREKAENVVCFNNEDATKLGAYILTLERAVKP